MSMFDNKNRWNRRRSMAIIWAHPRSESTYLPLNTAFQLVPLAGYLFAEIQCTLPPRKEDKFERGFRF